MPDTLGAGGVIDVARAVGALNIRSGEIIADLGCGTGHFAIALAKATGPSGMVYAVDVQTGPLESVQVRAEDLNISNIETIHADIEVQNSTGLADSTVSFSLFVNVLFQSTNRSAMIAEGVRILRPKGRIAIIDWKKGASGLGPPDDHRLTENEVKTLLIESGLKDATPISVGKYSFGFIATKA